MLLPLLGLVSAVALALYMIASRWLPLGLFGLLSYVEPVLLVVVAWLLGESMEPQQQLSYALIFAAVGLLIGDGRLNYGNERIFETYYALALNKAFTFTCAELLRGKV